MNLEEIARKLGMKQANLSLYGKELEDAGHIFEKGKNGKNKYTEIEFRMIQRMRELMKFEGMKRNNAAVKVVAEWEGSKEPTECKEEKTNENIDLQQEILNELKEIKQILNEMYINQSKVGVIDRFFGGKAKK